jgi:hypothetical protein
MEKAAQRKPGGLYPFDWVSRPLSPAAFDCAPYQGEH